jgi:hypothetical protein
MPHGITSDERAQFIFNGQGQILDLSGNDHRTGKRAGITLRYTPSLNSFVFSDSLGISRTLEPTCELSFKLRPCCSF